jgi:hypothetical protein
MFACSADWRGHQRGKTPAAKRLVYRFRHGMLDVESPIFLGAKWVKMARCAIAHSAVLGLWLLLLAGCSSFNPGTMAGVDPLLGGPPLTNPAPTKPQPSAPVTALPPNPAPGSAMSNAALAAATPPPLDANRELRIANPRSKNANDPWAGPVNAAVSNGSGAVLGAPQPLAEPAQQLEDKPIYTPAARDNRIATPLEQVKAQLTAHSVVWQKLEKTGENGEWKFSCAVPNRQNPKLRRTYLAVGADELAVMRAVLEQIDKEE